MVQVHPEWKKDLRLLRDLTRQRDRDRGRDLAAIQRSTAGQVDLETLADLDNLRQALLLRFLTEVGELAALGHPDYGSKLHRLIGELNTEANHNRAKLYVLEALATEPRVQEVISVTIRPSPDQQYTTEINRTHIEIDIALIPIGSHTAIALTIPFSFEGGVTL